MERLFTLPVRLRHSAHKVILIRANNICIGQVIVQNLANQALRTLTLVVTNLLSRSCKSALRRAMEHSKNHRLSGRDTLRRRRNAICKLGNNAEIELLLRLLGDRETKGMT